MPISARVVPIPPTPDGRTQPSMIEIYISEGGLTLSKTLFSTDEIQAFVDEVEQLGATAPDKIEVKVTTPDNIVVSNSLHNVADIETFVNELVNRMNEVKAESGVQPESGTSEFAGIQQ